MSKNPGSCLTSGRRQSGNSARLTKGEENKGSTIFSKYESISSQKMYNRGLGPILLISDNEGTMKGVQINES